MPGFNSFFLGHRPRSTISSDSPSPYSDDESEFETEASKNYRLQQERRHTGQVTSIYGTVMIRNDTERILTMLKRLNSDVETQIENFHDIGVTAEKKRKEAIGYFNKQNQRILEDGTKVLQRFRSAQGPLRELSEALGQLRSAVVGAGVDVKDLEGIVVLYQRGFQKSLRDVIKEFERALGRKQGWRDPV
jgi:hypothetical protein